MNLMLHVTLLHFFLKLFNFLTNTNFWY